MGGGFGVRRVVYIRMGGFDQSLATVGEDNDFAYRAVESGVALARSHCVKLVYRTSSKQSRRPKTIGQESRSRALLVRRYGIDPALVMRSWRIEPLRVLAAALKAEILRSGSEVDRAVADRWVAARGYAEGMVVYGRQSRVPAPKIGLGLHDGD